MARRNLHRTLAAATAMLLLPVLIIFAFLAWLLADEPEL